MTPPLLGHHGGRELSGVGWGPGALESRQGEIPLHVERDPMEEVTPTHTPPFILSKNQVKLQQGEFYAAQKAFTWLLCGHRTCTRPEHTAGTLGAQCRENHRVIPHPGSHRRSAAWPKSAIEALRFRPNRPRRRPKAGRRGEAGRGRGRPGLPVRSVRWTRFRKGPSPYA